MSKRKQFTMIIRENMFLHKEINNKIINYLNDFFHKIAL